MHARTSAKARYYLLLCYDHVEEGLCLGTGRTHIGARVRDSRAPEGIRVNTVRTISYMRHE
jgi:hypothetical protein